MNVLSGILLAALVLFMVGFLLKEIFGDRVAKLLAGRARPPAKSINDHLIGAVGKVVDDTVREGGHVRVRIGIERWSAKLKSTDGRTLPVGAEVKVTAVTGLVLEVEENTTR